MGSYVVQGRLEVSILINQAEFPLDTQNLLHFLHIGFSTRFKLPTVHFAVSDVQHTLDTISLQDGIPITIAIKPMQGQTTYYNFRKFHHKKVFNGKCFTYEIDGYLNCPLYWTGTTTAGIQGTSSDVMQTIATNCGLQYNGVTTNDSQLWVPRNRTYGEFAKAVASRGYISNSSYMVNGVDAAGTLFYQDVNNLPSSKANIVLGQLVQGSYTAIDYHPIANSGMNNKMQGYQHTRYDQSLISATPSQSYDQISFTPDAPGYFVNTAISQAITTGYKSFGGIDVGNTHSMYEQAVYQNRRFASLYSLAVEFQLYTPTQLTLFDRFTFSVDTDAQKQDVPYAGVYTIAAKALFITGANYSEKLLGVRQGTNQNYVAA